MKTYKIFILLLSVILLFSACEQEKQPVTSKEKGTFTVWTEGGIDADVLKSAWDEFVKGNSELQDKEVSFQLVDHNIGSRDVIEEETIMQSIEYYGYEGLDLIITDDYHTWLLGASDHLLDLTTLGADQHANCYYESVWELGKTDAALYGIPFSVNTTIYSGRKEVMDANNMQLPQTWEDMLSAGTTLRQSVNGDVFKEMWYCPKVSMSSNDTAILSWLWRLGGDLLTADGTAAAVNENNALTKAFTMMKSLKENGWLVGDTQHTGYNDASEGVFSALSFLELSYNTVERDYGLIPQLEENIPGYALKYGYCVSIPNVSQQQSLAYEFLQHLVFGIDTETGKAYQLLNDDTTMPALKALFSETGLSEEVVKIFTQQLSISKALPRVEGVYTYIEILGMYFNDVLFDDKAADVAAKEAEDAINHYLQESVF